MSTTGDTPSFLISTLSVRMVSSHWLQFYVNTNDPEINTFNKHYIFDASFYPLQDSCRNKMLESGTAGGKNELMRSK